MRLPWCIGVDGVEVACRCMLAFPVEFVGDDADDNAVESVGVHYLAAKFVRRP